MFWNKIEINEEQFINLFSNIFIRLGIKNINSTYMEISINSIYSIYNENVLSSKNLKFIERYLMNIKKKELKKFLNNFEKFDFTSDKFINEVEANKNKFPVMYKFITTLKTILDRSFFYKKINIPFDGKKEYIAIKNYSSIINKLSYNDFIVDNINSFKFEDSIEDKLNMFNYLQKKLFSFYLSPNFNLFSIYDIFPEYLEVPNMPPYCKMFFNSWSNINKNEYFIKYLFDFLENNFMLPEFRYSKNKDNNIENFILSNKSNLYTNKGELFIYENFIKEKNYKYLYELTDSYIRKYPYDEQILKFNGKISKILLSNSINEILESLLDLYRFSCNYFPKKLFNYHIYLLIKWYKDIPIYRDLLNSIFKVDYTNSIMCDLDNFLINMRDKKSKKEKLIFFIWFFFEFVATRYNNYNCRDFFNDMNFIRFLILSPAEWYISYFLFNIYNNFDFEYFYSGYLELDPDTFVKYNDLVSFIAFLSGCKTKYQIRSLPEIISNETDDIKLLFYNLRFIKENMNDRDKIKEIFRITVDIFNRVKESMPYKADIIETRLNYFHLLIDYCGVIS